MKQDVYLINRDLYHIPSCRARMKVSEIAYYGSAIARSEYHPWYYYGCCKKQSRILLADSERHVSIGEDWQWLDRNISFIISFTYISSISQEWPAARARNVN